MFALFQRYLLSGRGYGSCDEVLLPKGAARCRMSLSTGRMGVEKSDVMCVAVLLLSSCLVLDIVPRRVIYSQRDRSKVNTFTYHCARAWRASAIPESRHADLLFSASALLSQVTSSASPHPLPPSPRLSSSSFDSFWIELSCWAATASSHPPIRLPCLVQPREVILSIVSSCRLFLFPAPSLSHLVRI